MKILLIGAGNMGQTFAQSFLRSHIVSRDQLLILAKNGAQAELLAEKNLGRIFTDPAECLPLADLVIIGVKPQDSGLLFEKIRPFVDEQQPHAVLPEGVDDPGRGHPDQAFASNPARHCRMRRPHSVGLSGFNVAACASSAFETR